MPSLIKLFNINICAMIGVFLAGSASTSFDLIAPEYIGLVDLKTGTRLALTLLFGYWVFPGILLGSIGANMLFQPFDDIHSNIRVFLALLEATIPYLAVLFLHQLKLDKFYVDSRMSYLHLIPLCIITAVMSSLAMFAVMQSLGLTESYNLVERTGVHLTGALIGTFIVFFAFILTSRAFAENLKNN